MDTSKTSLGQQSQSLGHRLQEIEKTLRPHLGILPFKRLCDCLGIGPRVIGGLSYHFSVYGARTSLRTSENDRVFFIPIIEKAYPGRKERIRKFEVFRLIFERGASGGDFGYWGFHKAEFVPVYPDTIKSEYGTSVSDVVIFNSVSDLDRELEKIDLPSDFMKIVESAIGKWLMETIEKRKANLETLEGLQKTFPVGNFVLKYVLPSGKVLGYHLDGLCNIGGKKEEAKVYSAPHHTPKTIIPLVLKDFANCWKLGGRRWIKTNPHWEGATNKDIHIVAEAV